MSGGATTSPAVPKLRTGVPGLDIITHGGIPKGRTTLIAGRSGTAKSILSLHLATNLARSGTKTLLLAVEESPEDLRTTADSLGFDLTSLLENRLIAYSLLLIILMLTRPEGLFGDPSAVRRRFIRIRPK